MEHRIFKSHAEQQRRDSREDVVGVESCSGKSKRRPVDVVGLDHHQVISRELSGTVAPGSALLLDTTLRLISSTMSLGFPLKGCHSIVSPETRPTNKASFSQPDTFALSLPRSHSSAEAHISTLLPSPIIYLQPTYLSTMAATQALNLFVHAALYSLVFPLLNYFTIVENERTGRYRLHLKAQVRNPSSRDRDQAKI